MTRPCPASGDTVAYRDLSWYCYILHLLESIILGNASSKAAAIIAFFLAESRSSFDIFLTGSMKFFLEDWVGVNAFELGLEVIQGLSTAVGATTIVGKGIAIILNFVAVTTPVCVNYMVTGPAECTYQLPLPPPDFFTLFGSAST
ncbi:hypothetical protein R6Q59_010079 [Mikania micrantha]